MQRRCQYVMYDVCIRRVSGAEHSDNVSLLPRISRSSCKCFAIIFFSGSGREISGEASSVSPPRHWSGGEAFSS